MHENQLHVTPEVVRRLVADQFPELATLSPVPIRSEGTVNAIFRLGRGHAARSPLQPGNVDATRRQLMTEAAAAHEPLGSTRFPVPEPVAIGEPGAGYPLPWSVQTWIPGVTATHDDPSSSEGFARDLAEFIEHVRSIDVRGRTFSGEGRGGDIRSHDKWMAICFERSEHLVDVPELRLVWSRLRELPREAPDTMTHGDLTPGNVLVADGRLAGILDVGGLGAADPSLDLVGAWHLLAAGPRDTLRNLLRCDELEWERGKAWALQQAIGAVWYYVESNPPMSEMGCRTLERILAAESSA